MTSHAFKMQLKPGVIDEYRRRHDEIWPELAEAISAAGIYDYSIFLDEETLALFAVLKLRDDFNLPGMKILQFAFGDEMPRNDYIPHNYGRNFIAYTGTHDNNTVLGWYRQEGHRYHQQIEHYVGRAPAMTAAARPATPYAVGSP